MIYYSIYNILLKSSTTLFSYFFFFLVLFTMEPVHMYGFFFSVIIHHILGATGARADRIEKVPCCVPGRSGAAPGTAMAGLRAASG